MKNENPPVEAITLAAREEAARFFLHEMQRRDNFWLSYVGDACMALGRGELEAQDFWDTPDFQFVRAFNCAPYEHMTESTRYLITRICWVSLGLLSGCPQPAARLTTPPPAPRGFLSRLKAFFIR
jgi:hypothetical protein